MVQLSFSQADNMRNKIIYYKPLIAGVALGALAAVSKDAWHVVPLGALAVTDLVNFTLGLLPKHKSRPAVDNREMSDLIK
jgi:hypothetical protein